MKLILDIQDNRVPFFMELINGLDYISVLKEVKDKEKSKAVQDLVEAFHDVKQHHEGKKQLKSAKDIFDKSVQSTISDKELKLLIDLLAEE